MALNPFFTQGTTGEQNLVQDLINEQLRMYGVEVYYLPRRYITKNTVIREVVESKFENSYPIEAYVDNYDGYGDNTVMLSKFGIQATNEITLTISRERFEDYITPLISNLSNIELSTRPKEGDLIYFPLGDRLFEIKFVEHEKPFYQLKKNYIYTLQCELFRPEDEVIDTGIGDIDDEVIDVNVRTLTLLGAGTIATLGDLSIVNGALGIATLTNRGQGYTVAPTVAISSAPTGGVTAVGIATLISNMINCEGTTVGEKVQGVEITNPGAGYTVDPGIVFLTSYPNPGVGAAASTTMADGAIGIVTITSGGSGYTTAPAVTFSSPGIGTTAIAIAVVSSAGTISAIRFRNAGAGYTGGDSPTVTIGAPYQGGSGSYVQNETITGSESGTTALVKSWDAVTGELDISQVTGDFIVGENVTGDESSAVYQVKSTEKDNTVDAFGENLNIETAADSILDFTEKNPFGTP